MDILKGVSSDAKSLMDVVEKFKGAFQRRELSGVMRTLTKDYKSQEGERVVGRAHFQSDLNKFFTSISRAKIEFTRLVDFRLQKNEGIVVLEYRGKTTFSKPRRSLDVTGCKVFTLRKEKSGEWKIRRMASLS